MNGINGYHAVAQPERVDYASALEKFRKSDAERDTLVSEIIGQYEKLKHAYEEKCDDFNSEVESRRLWQSKAKTNEAALTEHKQVSGSNSFVAVVIDGDGAIFQDYLYAQGKEGGAEAAHLLFEGIKNDLKQMYPDTSIGNLSIVVHVVLNLQGLATKLQACNIVVNPNELTSFGRSFGLAQPLFNFIDVGSGKERADHKIRETLRLFLPNSHCKHVFFGPTHDNGYIVFLENYKRDYGNKLTLIETRPSEPGFRDLGLNMTRYPQVFRKDNLPMRPNMGGGPAPFSPTASHAMPSHAMPPQALANRTNLGMQMQATSAAYVPTKSPSPSLSQDSVAGAPSTWATVGKTTTGTKNIDVAPKKTPPRRHILLNVYDERLDIELPRPDPGAEKRFGERMKSVGKCCNRYHLLGHCEYGEYCDYTHGEKLSPGEQLVLKHKARSRSCPSRYACRDFDCTFGHHCKFGKGCLMDQCWFADTHHTDLEPAKRMFQDGQEEWLQAYLEKVRT